MAFLTRLIAPAALAAALGVGGSFAAPAAHAADDLVRVIVDIADVVFRSGQPYYRYDDHEYRDRLIVDRDRYGRPIYYRHVPREVYRQGPPYGNAWGYHRNRGHDRRDHARTRCDSRGRCRVEYYDPRYDNRYGYGRDDDRYDRHRRYDHRYDDRRYYSRHDRHKDGDDD
jgi:hypothetical protein